MWPVLKTSSILFARGEKPPTGPQNGRQFSAPIGGATTLTTPPIHSGTGNTASSDKGGAI